MGTTGRMTTYSLPGAAITAGIIFMDIISVTAVSTGEGGSMEAVDSTAAGSTVVVGTEEEVAAK